MSNLLRVPAVLAAFVLAGSQCAFGQSDPAVEAFKNPPEAAKPRTWWHWTKGNVSKEGITKDLEWMKRVGIGGFQLADVNSGRGQTVEKPIDFGTPEWLEAVRHAGGGSGSARLEMAILRRRVGAKRADRG